MKIDLKAPINAYVELEKNHIIKSALNGCTVKVNNGKAEKIVFSYVTENGDFVLRKVNMDTKIIEGIYITKEYYQLGVCANMDNGCEFEVTLMNVLKSIGKAVFRFENKNDIENIYIIGDKGDIKTISEFSVSFDIDKYGKFSNAFVFSNDTSERYKEFFFDKEMAIHFTSVKVTEDGVTRQEPSLASRFMLNEEQKEAFKELEQAIKKCDNKGISLIFNYEECEIFGYNRKDNELADKVEWDDDEEIPTHFSIQQFADTMERVPMIDCNDYCKPMINIEEL